MKPQAVLWALAAFSLASASSILSRQSTAAPPSQDPFYQPDAGFESKLPGAILKSRKLPQAWSSSIATYQLLFRSTDSNGKPNAVVTSILEPKSANPKKLVSTLYTSDASFADCLPSYILRNDSNPENASPPDNDYVLRSALAEGWYVAVPDYEGFDAAFTNGVQEGHAALDSLRAALASTDITGLEPDATLTLTGYSGGGVACEFAAELQPCYAPELKIAGIVAGGITPNITNTFLAVTKTRAAGIIPPGIFGLSAQDEGFRAHIESLLFPQNASEFNYALTHCARQTTQYFANKDIRSYFTAGENIVRDEMVVDFVNKFGIMGVRDTPQMPMYVFKGALDEISPTVDTDVLVDQYCAAGADIQYSKNEGINHEDEIVGQYAAWNWQKDRMNGVPAPTGCSTTVVPLSEATPLLAEATKQP